ncbi:FabD/lysophospholipase-like protein, partial [Acephala macrosclerotiorum]
DGGGIRGYASLWVLKLLMDASSDPESLVAMSECFLPCHYFDYIGGTSTGGLNAIMLGRLRMSVEECLDQYPRMAENVFSGTK